MRKRELQDRIIRLENVASGLRQDYANARKDVSEVMRRVEAAEYENRLLKDTINKRNITVREQKKKITYLKGRVTTLRRRLGEDV